MRRFTLAPVLLLICLSVFAAPRPLTRSEQAVINFGFATQLGSGIYTMSGRTLQVYTLPLAYELPSAQDSRLSLRLTLPVTIGFVDFEPRDVVESGLPEHLDSFGFVPGVAVGVRMTAAWQLEPFVEAGLARDRSNEVDERIFSVGLRSRHELGHGVVAWQFYEDVVHVVVDEVSTDHSDDFTRLRLAATARRPFDVTRQARRPDFLVYGLAEVYTDSPVGPVEARVDHATPVQAEFGITFGATEPIRVWGIALPRVGIGYRFGEGLSVVRVVIGSPY